MLQAFLELMLFSAKTLIIFLFILLMLIAFFALISKAKEKMKHRLIIKNINKGYKETTETILTETLSKKEFKQFLKEEKQEEKNKAKRKTKDPHVYVLNFTGDMKASAVSSFRDEITAILNIATPTDEVIVRLESAGGIVHDYGLAAAQLMRLRARKIPLTITIDKVAASGGYMMACIANKILAAPFAIVGSIGVIVQLPNFHRLLKDKHVDFEQHTAGEYKRTITLFGQNTEEGREKLQEEIEGVHTLFKNLISEHRPQVDIDKVATGEYWYGQQALALKLVDELTTSDDYVLARSKEAQVYELCYETKKPLLSRLTGAVKMMQEKLVGLGLR